MGTTLSDMEELLGRIDRKSSRDYMSEALRCYNNAAHRACIVLASIAVFDDLRAKLGDLSKVNSKAKLLHKEIEKRAGAQDVYETYLCDQLTTNKLVDAAQSLKLQLIRDLRNKSAHPSGLHPSAEEARFVFFEAVDKFLSRPSLQTTDAVDSLVLRLSEANFFPSAQLSEMKAVAVEEMATIDATAWPYLVSELVDGLSSPDKPLSKASRWFLLGMAARQDNVMRAMIRKKVVEAKCTDLNCAELIVMLLRVDPELMTALPPVALSRIDVLVKDVTDKAEEGHPPTRLAHPVSWLRHMVSSHGQNAISDNFPDATTAILKRYAYDRSLMDALNAGGDLLEEFLAIFTERCRSTNFSTANAAVSALPELSDALGEAISEKAAFALLAATCRSAEAGAFDAINLHSANFSSVPELKQKAFSYSAAHASAATKKLEKESHALGLAEFEALLKA